MRSIAIIGAGLSGLVVARRLQAVADVTVFEKSRGSGGRMATRYAGDYEFDHGAQFFTARTPGFRDFLKPLIDEGVVADWPARFAEFDRHRLSSTRQWGAEYPHFVGVPRMNRIGKSLAAGLQVELQTTVGAIHRTDRDWALRTPDGGELGRFDWVVLTAPAPQTALLGGECPDLVELAERREMSACFALLLGFDGYLDLTWDAALVRNADISWMSVNSSKPGRGKAPTLVVHSTNRWANAHIDANRDRVIDVLLREASEVAGKDLANHSHCDVQRWRYANLDRQCGDTCFVDRSRQIAACGDWFVRGRVEAAFTSANALAAQLREQLC